MKTKEEKITLSQQVAPGSSRLSAAESCYVPASAEFPPIIFLPSNINRGFASCSCRLSINPPEQLAHFTCSKFSRSESSLAICVRLCEKKKRDGALKTIFRLFLHFHLKGFRVAAQPRGLTGCHCSLRAHRLELERRIFSFFSCDQLFSQGLA